jgi:phosphoribosylformylglycinamidine synthase
LKPRALVLTGFGINCDYETGYALSMPGVEMEVDACHANDLVAEPERLDRAHLFVLPGGFSYGDHLGSGRVLGNRLKTRVGEAILRFVGEGKLVLGICNGFQVLVKMGLLPGNPPGTEPEWTQRATLFRNDSGRFEDRWVHLKVREGNPCAFLEGIDDLYLPVRHGEGKLIFAEGVLDEVIESGQDVIRYAGPLGNPTSVYPENPNGSQGNLAALCDVTGRIFGLMPHPEAFLHRTNHPRWTREDLPEEGQGVALFRNAAQYLRKEFCRTGVSV